MVSIIVQSITGPFCGTSSQGDALYSQIVPVLKRNEEIELDFKGIELASSSFFSAVIGRAIEEFGWGHVRHHMRYRSLKPRHEFVLDRTMKAIHT